MLAKNEFGLQLYLSLLFDLFENSYFKIKYEMFTFLLFNSFISKPT